MKCQLPQFDMTVLLEYINITLTSNTGGEPTEEYDAELSLYRNIIQILFI